MTEPSRPVVCIEVTPLLETYWTGIPVFTRRLISALQSCSEVSVSFHYNGLSVPSERVNETIRHGSGAALLATIDTLRKRQSRTPDPSAFYIWPSAKKSGGLYKHEASVIHDLSTLFQPELHMRENIDYHLSDIEHEIASSERIFCASESTRIGLCSAFPSARAKSATLFQYVDWPPHFAEIDANLPQIDFGPYAVVLGTLEPRKNLSVVFRALSEGRLRHTSLSLVVIGRQGWLVDQALKEMAPRDRSRVLFTGFVSEFTKYRLLKHCRFVIAPSVYEGFGIPALEAMSLGRRVMASRSSSFPEVIGNAGVLFDPYSPAEFADAFTELDQLATDTPYDPVAVSRNARFNPQGMTVPVLNWISSAS